MSEPVHLNSAKVGVIVFTANNKDYICSAFNMSMILNQIPTASVMIGCGYPIKNEAKKQDNNAEDLYKVVQRNTSYEEASFIPCTVKEVLPGKEIKVFVGVIVAASLVYKTSGMTVRAIRLDLMHPACQLQAQPITAYRNVCGSYIVKAMRRQVALAESLAAIVASTGMTRDPNKTWDMISGVLNKTIMQKDIVTRIACIIDAFILVASRMSDKTNPLSKADLGNIVGIKKYLRSAYTLDRENLKVANKITDEFFNKELGTFLIASVANSSIFESILTIIQSTEFMLMLAPRFADEQLEIMPSKAWGASGKITQLSTADISSINSVFQPLRHINDPDTFIVTFRDAISMTGNAGHVGDPGGDVVGAYSSVPEVAEMFANRFNNQLSPASTEKLLKSMSKYKWKVATAPQWLYSAFVQLSTESTKPQMDNQASLDQAMIDAIEKQEISDTVTQEKEKPHQGVPYNFTVAKQLADQVAQALYTFLYKQSATTEVTLLPHLRFGLSGKFTLENMLGELIDIVPGETTEEDRLSDDTLAVRGLVTAITFSYTAGQSANCEYTMSLSRVRPVDDKEPVVNCPLYAKIK